MHTMRKSHRNYSPQDGSAGVGLDLGAWFGFLWEKKWIFVLCCLVTGILGVVCALSLQKFYTAKAVVMIDAPLQPIQDAQAFARDPFQTPESIKAVEGAFASQTLILRVVKKNDLDKNHPAFQPKPGQPPLSDAELVDIMSDRYNAKLQRASRLIDIKVDDEDPERAAKLAQSFVDEYMQMGAEQDARSLAGTNQGLLNQADDIRQRLEKSERQLQEYREKYGTASLEDKKDITTDKLKEINRRLAEAKNTRIQYESELDGLTNVDKASLRRLLGIQSIASQKDVGDLQRLLADAQSQFAEVRKSYGPRHPKYREAAGQVGSLQEDLDGIVRNYARGLVNAFKASKQTEEQLSKELAEQERLSVELTGIGVPYAVLQREVEANRTLYDQVLQRMKQMQVNENIERPNIRQVQAPVVPKEPSKPRRAVFAVLSVMIGFALAFFIVLAMRALDSSLRSVDEAESLIQMPMLAAVPLAKLKRGKARAEATLLQINSPGSAQAEAYRGLRASIALLPDGQPRRILFTSSVPGEGKTFTVANYAIALAQQGFRTALIDGDLRRPGLATLFPMVMGNRGLADYLGGRATVAEIQHPTKVANLSIIPAGDQRSKPAELLGNREALQHLMNSLSDYDVIVVDTAPVLAVSDPLLLVPHVESVVLVVRSKRTRQREITRALQLLDQSATPLAGFVFNCVPRTATYHYAQYVGEYAAKGA
jgi:capsular exopolysaccharide synthesis family protein